METKLNFGLLKKLYSIHSPSGQETRMIKFLVSYLKTLPGVELGKDKHGNLYAWKGESQTYPCVVCHIDQVQRTHSKDFKAIETRDIIFGYSAMNHQFEGLGADDKNGILICLESLRKYDVMKCVFFREEETGCKGSSNCEMSFFNDCRFVIQPDRRGNSDLITSIGCIDLCSEKFIRDIDPEEWGYTETTGMMTDVEALKEQGLPVSAVNISTAYFNAHTSEEITVKRDLVKCWRFVQHIIEDCTEVYPHEAGEHSYYGYYDDWEIEEDIHSLLQQDPTLTGADLYDMYQTNYPMLTADDFERIVAEHKCFYSDDDDYEPLDMTPDNGDKKNDFEILGDA